jgi:DNA processing protein
MKTTRISPDDPTFPAALLELPARGLAPCDELHVRGEWPPLPGVAIVGTRRPTPEARRLTRELAQAVVEAGWAVWSGGALGIDAEAHQAAIDHGGATVVVCPSGLGELFPPEHGALFAQVVASGGTLVSPFADDVPAAHPHFHRRNDVLACLTMASVVVEAPYRSGARSTARAARRLGRPLFAVPHAPWDPRGQGCAVELANGARPVISAKHLLACLDDVARSPGRATRERTCAPAPHASQAPASQAHASHALSPHASRVLEAIGETPIHVDDLCERTALPFASVTAALLTLTLQAVVVEAPAGFYRRPPFFTKSP